MKLSSSSSKKIKKFIKLLRTPLSHERKGRAAAAPLSENVCKIIKEQLFVLLMMMKNGESAHAFEQQ
jgi:hypothetical protein